MTFIQLQKIFVSNITDMEKTTFYIIMIEIT